MTTESPAQRRRVGRGRRGLVLRTAVVLSSLALLTAGTLAARLLAPGVSAISRPVPRAPGERIEIPPLTSQDPINLLLLGADDDPKFDPKERLTQTMLVVHIDPARRHVVLFSIPRDLWVKIPGHPEAKIDFAYRWGGVALARQTVTELFHVPIHFYGYVGLAGVVRVVDTLGGVDVDVLHPIVDETYPDDVGTENPFAAVRLYLPPGPQHLDGRRALEYMRSRHGDWLSDFGRNIRQQQVVVALNKKLQVIDLVSDLPRLVQNLEGHVESDLGLIRAAQLALLARSLKPEDIEQVVLLKPEFVDDGWSRDGQAILVPHWPQILGAVQRYFGAPR